MRVLCVSNFYDTHGGGLERVAGHLCRELAGKGHIVYWAACQCDELPNSIVNLVPLDCNNTIEMRTGLPVPIPMPASIGLLWRNLKNVDTVIIHDSLYLNSIAALVMAKLGRKPIILIQHIGSIEFSSAILTLIMKLANFLVTRSMMKAANRVVFISRNVLNEFVGEYSKISYLFTYNGIATDIFKQDNNENVLLIRSRWQLPKEKPLLLFVGRFVAKKGLNIVYEIARQRPDLHFALVGRGPINPHVWDLDNVSVVGQLDQPQLASLYRASDLLILPSVGEGFPLVIQEAMACGLPVLTNKDNISADPDAGGFLRGVSIIMNDPYRTAKYFCEEIDHILKCPPDCDAMANYAKLNYSWKVMADNVINGI